MTVSYRTEVKVLAMRGVAKIKVLGLMSSAKVDRIGPHGHGHGLQRLIGLKIRALAGNDRSDVILQRYAQD